MAIRNATPREKPYKLFDSGGLFLLVTPTGAKLWRWKYRLDGKEKLAALGAYPEVPLAGGTVGGKGPLSKEWVDGARDKRDAMRKLLAAGKDPAALRREIQQKKREADARDTLTVRKLAEEWIKAACHGWTKKLYLRRPKRIAGTPARDAGI